MDDARHKRTFPRISTIALPSSLYAAALLGVAAFLLLFVLFPEPIQQYTAHIEVQQEALDNADAAVSLALISPAKVDQIADDVLANESPTTTYRANVTPLSELKTRVEIEISSRHAADSLAFCQTIAKRVVDSQPASIVPRAEEYRSLKEDALRRLSLIQDSERALEDVLNNLEREHLSQSLAQLREYASSQSQATSAKPVESDLATVWQAARTRLQELENRRAEMMVRRTNLHPAVQELNFQIQEQLAAMARLPKEVAQSTVDPSGNASRLAEMQQVLNDYQTRAAELMASREQIRSRREKLERELTRLSQSLPSIALQTAISSPATIVNREGGRPSKIRLAMMLAAAVTAAGITFYAMQQLGVQSTVPSIDQLSQSLGLPVVSVLKVARPHLREKRELEWMRSAVFSAELLLLGLALALMFAFGSVSELSQPASEDPFGVVAEAFDRIGETSRRR